MNIQTRLTGWLASLSAIADTDSDTAKERRAHRFLIYLGALMSSGGLVWGSISIASGIFYESFIPYAYALITLLNFTYLNHSKDFRIARFVQVLISLLLPFFFQFALGGFFASGGVVLWSILTVLGSFAFLDRRVALRWFVLYLLLIWICGLLDRQLSFVTLEVPPSVSLLFVVLNYTLISSIIFTLFYYFVVSEEKLQFQLQQLANTDPLSGLPNRRAFFEQGEVQLEKVRRGSDVFSVVIFDIDHFKKVNDSFGHCVGDKAIISFGHLLQQQCRKVDIAARYGGEEFIVLLHETGIENAACFARRVIEACRRVVVKTGSGHCSFTVSAGLAQVAEADRDLYQSVDRADKALYAAKEAGRDRMEIA